MLIVMLFLCKLVRWVDEFAMCFLGFEVNHVKREENWNADALARMGSERVKTLHPGVFVQHLYKPSIQRRDVDYLLVSESIAILFVTPDSTVVYLNFLVDQKFPEGANKFLQRQIKR